ncbi:hypothetical protein [Massilia antarctica]|uniref:hypothetical protein n=1 Tax=Massilia antarctica TaxID=2765360 RepID=UPI0035EA1198
MCIAAAIAGLGGHLHYAVIPIHGVSHDLRFSRRRPHDWDLARIRTWPFKVACRVIALEQIVCPSSDEGPDDDASNCATWAGGGTNAHSFECTCDDCCRCGSCYSCSGTDERSIECLVIETQRPWLNPSAKVSPAFPRRFARLVNLNRWRLLFQHQGHTLDFYDSVRTTFDTDRHNVVDEATPATVTARPRQTATTLTAGLAAVRFGPTNQLTQHFLVQHLHTLSHHWFKSVPRADTVLWRL